MDAESEEGMRSLVLDYSRLALHEALLSRPLLMSTFTGYNPGGDRAIQTATLLLPSPSPTHSASEDIQKDCFNHLRAQVALLKKRTTY